MHHPPQTVRATIRVGIVEDLDTIREGLADLVADSPGFACAGAWSSMEAALQDLRTRQPDVLLVDLGLPGMDGIEGIKHVRASWPKVVPVVLSVYQDDDRIFRALCAGACGYLLKKTPDSEILRRLEEAVSGGAPISPEIARQVVNLFVDGHNYRTAGSVLGVTRSTVAFHVRKIYEKLAVHSKSEAVAKALRDGLLR